MRSLKRIAPFGFTLVLMLLGLTGQLFQTVQSSDQFSKLPTTTTKITTKISREQVIKNYSSPIDLVSSENIPNPIIDDTPELRPYRRRLLDPEIFHHLSATGRQAALLINNHLALRHHHGTGVIAPTISGEADLVGDNSRVNNPRLDSFGITQSETSVAANGNNILVSFNDTAGIDLILRSIDISAYGISTNGGASFEHRRLPVGFHGFNLGDGVVAYGPNGEAYYATLAFSGAGISQVGVSRSIDQGLNFFPPVSASTTASNETDFQDKEWIAVDRGASSPFKGNVYVSWTHFKIDKTSEATAITLAASNNGANSFNAPVEVTPPGALVQGSMPAVGPKGEVYVVFEELALNQIQIVKSLDGGRTFSAPQTIAQINSISFSNITGGNGVRVNSFPSITVDKAGTVHIVYAAAADLFTPDRSDIFYLRSTDGGKTFAPPRKINDDGTNTIQVNPAIAVADSGALGVKWWDRRNDTINDSLTDVYMATSTDGGASFSENFRITNHHWIFGPKEPLVAGGYHGDYDGIAADGNNFLLAWSDERNANPDIYFTATPINTRPDAPDFDLTTRDLAGAVRIGESVEFELLTSGQNGFNRNLQLSAIFPQQIDGFNLTFDRDLVAAGDTAHLKITTNLSANPGTYLTTIIAKDDNGVTRRTNITLTVYDRLQLASVPVNITHTPGFSQINSEGLRIDARGTVHLVYEDDSNVASGNIRSNLIDAPEFSFLNETTGEMEADKDVADLGAEGLVGGEVFYKRSTDHGQTFSTPIKVSTNSRDSFGSRAAIDQAGNIYLVWTSRNTDRTQFGVFFAVSSDQGQTFSEPRAISLPNHNADGAGIAVDQKGNLMISYGDVEIGAFGDQNQKERLMMVRSIDHGQSFSSPQVLSLTNENVIASQIIFDSQGRAQLIYNDIRPTEGEANISLVTATDGEHFGAPKQISPRPISLAFLPHMAIDRNDNLFVVFSRGLQPGFDVNILRSTDAGGTFTKQVNISANRGNSAAPVVVPDNRGNVTVFWDDTTPDRNNPDILMARSIDGGVSFPNMINISANPGVSMHPCAAADQFGNILLAWTDDTTANSEVMMVSLPFFTNLPTISGIDPTSGQIGSRVTINGANLANVTAVKFTGDVAVATADFTVASDGSAVNTIVPIGALSGPITLITADGVAISSEPFTVLSGSFTLAISPTSQTIAAGASTSFTIELQANSGFADSVELAVATGDANITGSLSSNSLKPGERVTLTINASAATIAQTYPITITGTAGTISAMAIAQLIVVSPDFSVRFDPTTITLKRGQTGQLKVNIDRIGGFTAAIEISAPASADLKALKLKLTPASQSTSGSSVDFNFKLKANAPTGSHQLIFTGRDNSGRVRTATLTVMIE